MASVLRDATFGVATHDVIIRYLRCRLGDVTSREEDSLDVWNGSSNVIFDHCSATWSIDECLSLSGNNQNITIQWCLIGESLNHSKHSKGDARLRLARPRERPGDVSPQSLAP